MRLRYGSTYWLEHAKSSSAPRFPLQRGTLDADVTIVGGGFTGCVIAHVFTAAGARVALLERNRLGLGSAAASTALLMQEPDRSLRECTRLFGKPGARLIWRVSRQAVRNLTSLLAGFDCDLHRVPAFHMALDARGAMDLRRDHRARRAAGLPGRLLDGGALERATGIEGAAAIQSSGDAVADPYRATLALAAAAQQAGARIFERSEALRVTGTRSGVVTTTAHGTVRSAWAIVATGFATPAFKPLTSRFTMATTYVIATDPIAARARSRMGEGPIMFWDDARPYHYFRWTDDNRVLFGGEDRPVPRSSRSRRAALVKGAAALERKLRELYPGIESIRIDRAWEGLFATTPDGLPYIGPHRRFPRQLFALGYGGNGMTFAFLAARILLRHVLGRPKAGDAIFGFSRGR